MPGGSQDYYLRFITELYGKGIDAFQEKLKATADSIKVAEAAAKQWGAEIEIGARRAGVGVDKLTAALKEQAKAYEKAQQEAKKLAEAEGKRLDALEKANRKRLEELLNPRNGGGGGGGNGGGGGGGGGGGSSIFGRIGGRILGAEAGGALGLPGSGFIGSQLAGGLGISGGAALGLGGLALGAFGAVKAEEIIKYAQEQRNLANAIGITVVQMDALSRTGESVGVNLQNTVKTVAKLSEELLKGGPRAREITESLKRLGLSDSTAFKNSADALTDIAAALSKISDPAERAQTAVRLLGEDAREFAGVADKIPDLSAKLKLDDHTLTTLAAARDHLGSMWQSLKGIAATALAGTLDFFSGNPQLYTAPTPSAYTGALQFSSKQLAGVKPIRGSISISGSGITDAFTDLNLSPEERKSRALAEIRSTEQSSGTPEDKYQAQLETFKTTKETLEADRLAGRIGSGEFKSGYAANESAKSGAEAAKRAAEELRSQRERFAKLPPVGQLSQSQAVAEGLRLPQEFNRMVGTPAYNARISALSAVFSQGFQEWQQYIQGPRVREQFTKTQEEELAQQESTYRNAEAIQDYENRQAVGEIGRTGSGSLLGLRGAYGVSESTARLRGAVGAGYSRYGLTPSQITAREYSQSLAQISSDRASKVALLEGESSVYLNQATQLDQIDSPEARLKTQEAIAEFGKKQLELESAKIDSETKSIDALNKFNEAVDKAAEGVRDQLSGGLTSIILGGQHGNARGAAKSFGEGIETQLIDNVLKKVLDVSGITGKGGALSKVGGILPPWLTQGTIFQNIDPKITGSIDASKFIQQIAINTAVVAGKVGGGVGGAVAGAIPGGTGGGGLAGPFSTISRLLTGGGSSSSSALTGGADTGYTSDGVQKYSTENYKNGTYIGPASSNDPSAVSYGSGTHGGGANYAGAIAGGLGIAGGVIGLAKSGSVGGKLSSAGAVAAGIGATLAALAPALAAAGPIGAAVGAAAALAAAFIPDPRQQRQQQIERTMFTNQYLAPPAWNISEGGGGGYADTGFDGNVRTSSLSPFPTIGSPYLDNPRRTVVPGHTISSFGGTGVGKAGAIVSPTAPITIVINAVDPQSFHSLVQRNPSAISNGLLHAINGGHATELTATLGSHLGLR